MKTWAVIGVVLIVFVGVLASGMTDLYVSAKVRYKITVNVDTPEGLKSGSAVTEVTNSDSILFEAIALPEVNNPAKVRGEAVVVDLGKYGTLFALLNGYRSGNDYSDRILYKTFGGGTNISKLRELRRLKVGQKVTLPPYDYPLLVTFKDLNDPKTVTSVFDVKGISNPFHVEDVKIKDRFEENFGPGVKIKDITIEITNERTAAKIEEHLPWLADLKGGYLSGKFSSSGEQMGLHGGDFKRVFSR